MMDLTFLRRAAAGAAVLLAAGCAHRPPAPVILNSYVVLGEDGARVARAITTDASCPAFDADGARLPGRERAGPATLPARAPAKGKGADRAAAFPVRVCEAILPARTARASVGGHPLPLPPRDIRRLVVLGDTGCRLVAADRNYQDCNDPQAYPFAAIARAAAAFRPDLVIHVGDYHYREDPCPRARAGCRGSPSGYGWDAWNADFFTPAAPLLQAAPLVAARGNHETCARAGAGFLRLLDPRPLAGRHDCVTPADDALGNHSAPYAVPLGGGVQLAVLDTANSDYRGLAPGDPRRRVFERDARALDTLTRQAAHTIVIHHQPLLAYGARPTRDGRPQLYGGDKGLIDSFGAVHPLLFPPGVQFVLSGHVHVWEQVSFASGHPSQFVAGFSGTAEDLGPLPLHAPEALPPAPGAVVERMSSWIGGFGYMTLERLEGARWEARIWDRAGRLRNRCRIDGRHSDCEVDQVPAVTP